MKPGMSTELERPFYRKHFVGKLGTPARKKHEQETTHAPKLSYGQAMRSWFVYGGQPYNVETCPHATFSAYIESVTPTSWGDARRHAAIALWPDPETERLLSRWYTLDALITAKVAGLRLFASCAEAMSNRET